MTGADSIKRKLIDRILATKNEKFLEAFEKLFLRTKNKEEVSLYPEQKEMLMMSEEDNRNESFIAQDEFYRNLLVNVLKRKMDDFWFRRKRKFSNSSVINEFYFEA